MVYVAHLQLMYSHLKNVAGFFLSQITFFFLHRLNNSNDPISHNIILSCKPMVTNNLLIIEDYTLFTESILKVV